MTTTTKTSPHQRVEEIREALQELRLTDMVGALERELDAGPPQDDSRLDFLWRLLRAQLYARRERGIERRIKAAKFPSSKTLDDFNFDFQPKLDRDRVMEYATLEFIRRSKSLLIAGMSGTGKTHISIALGHLACAAEFRVRYTSSANLLSTLHAAHATGFLQQALKPYLRCDLLIIDEVGLDLPERRSVANAHLFYKVISARYDANRPCIITSNIKWDEWGTYLGDDVATVAILDRLVHHGYTLNIDGPSYRAAEHKALNYRPKTTVADPDSSGDEVSD